MLPGEQESLLKNAKRKCGLDSIEFGCQELLNQSVLLMDALFQISDVAPYSDRNGLVHAVTPRHRAYDLGVDHRCAELKVNHSAIYG